MASAMFADIAAAATGSDSGAAVSSCILDADNLLTPSGLLVLVFDRLRVFAREIPVSFSGSGIVAGPGARGSEESLEGSTSLWLSLDDGSGVGTPPLIGLDGVWSRESCDGSGEGGGRGSLGVSIGEGKFPAPEVFLEALLKEDAPVGGGSETVSCPRPLPIALSIVSVLCREWRLIPSQAIVAIILLVLDLEK